MLSLGIDPSATSTGVVILEGEKPVLWQRLRYPKLKGLTRAAAQAAELIDILEDFKIDYAAMETPFTSKNPEVFRMLVEVATLLRYILFAQKIPTVLVSPTQLKQFVGAKGSAKSDVAGAVKEMYGFENKYDDIVDAYVLAMMARCKQYSNSYRNTGQRGVIGKTHMLK
jgi:Holliday junction resolvasome RuvABC endonuclease subunit